MTLGLFFSIASFTILLVVMYFLIKIYLAQPATSTTTCSGRKPFSLEGAKRENQEKVIREQRELQAGIPWNNEGAERTGMRGAVDSPLQKKTTKITVLTCEQKPYPLLIASVNIALNHSGFQSCSL